MKNSLKYKYAFLPSVLFAFAALAATNAFAAQKSAVTDAPGEGISASITAGDDKPIVPLAPEKYRRPKDWKPQRFGMSLKQLSDKYSESIIRKGRMEYERVCSVNGSGVWKATPQSIDSHKCPEWFVDAKFGIFIDWGLWSVASWSPKRDAGAMYPDWYEFRMYSDFDKTSQFWGFKSYHEKNWGADFKRDDFIPLFRAEKYNPEALVKTFKESGAKYVVPFTKHHSGFCLWASSYTFRDASDRGPKRDLIAPLVSACRNEGLKFGFYFSHSEWEYPVLDENGNLKNCSWNHIVDYSEDMETKASGKIAVKDFVKEYIIPQAVEFIDKYSPDILWFDGDWATYATDMGSYDIAAYFYNVNEGKKSVAVNDRYGRAQPEEIEGRFTKRPRKWLRTVRGDFYTDEFGDTSECIDPAKYHPWEACRGISQSYGNNWQDDETNVIGTRDFVCMFADMVARGGNLLLLVNLDSQGDIPEVQKRRLEAIGSWLEKNGKAIYSTRIIQPFATDEVAYTRSKDSKTAYAIVKKLSPKVFVAHAPKPGGEIIEISDGKSMKWEYKNPSNPSEGAYVYFGEEQLSKPMPVALEIPLE